MLHWDKDSVQRKHSNRTESTKSFKTARVKVLDLRNVHQNFWNVWTGGKHGIHSAETGSEKQVAKRIHRYALRWRMKVVTDLSLSFPLTEYQTCLLQWAQNRKDSLRLSCLKMKICALPVKTIREILNIFHPNYIEELEIHTDQVLSFLGSFAPCLGQMRNLIKFRLRQTRSISGSGGLRFAEVKKCTAKFLSHFSKLNCLQHLSMHGDFSSGHMKQLFRCLKIPLESLSMIACQLSKGKYGVVSDCLDLNQLTHLNLSGVVVSPLSTGPLHVLLKRVTATLKTLELEGCRMKVSQVSALLPALSQCTQLTKTSFYDNESSMAVLQDILHHTRNLS
ncbi:PRAME family member 12-like [Mastomys coucha]|uniref:PRAME family member 12-like n=1 Tax=Mastomys coucha TaxID=35658 RepID=UPI0012617D47|nr:PRAME family member 12-like [Mastomys coucha]